MCICTPRAAGPAAGDLAVAAGACGSEGICVPYADASVLSVYLLPPRRWTCCRRSSSRRTSGRRLPSCCRWGWQLRWTATWRRASRASFLAGLKQRLLLPEHEYINSGYGTKYNVELLNSLVFYVGIKVGGLNLLRSSPMRAIFQPSPKKWAAEVMHQQVADTG